MENSKLILTIKHDKPVELVALAQSMIAFADEFDRSSHTPAKLYVKEIRKGSIVQELIAIASVAPILIAQGNSIIEFAEKIKSIFDWYCGHSNTPPKTDKATLENMVQVLAPIIKDDGSQLNIGAINPSGEAIVNVYINTQEAKNSKKQIIRDIQLLENEEVTSDINRTNTGREFFKVRAPDMLGEAQWKVIRGGRAIGVSITDTKWLEEYHQRKHPLLPEDSLDAEYTETINYDENGNEINRKISLHKIHETKKPPVQATIE